MGEVLGPGSQTAHLLTSSYLALGVLAITAIALGEFPLSSESDRIITMGITLLLASIVVAVGNRFEQLWVPLAMVFFGLLATGVSSAHSVVFDPSNPVLTYPCCVTRVNRGFPLPWSFTYEFFGGGRYTLLPPYPILMLDWTWLPSF